MLWKYQILVQLSPAIAHFERLVNNGRLEIVAWLTCHRIERDICIQICPIWEHKRPHFGTDSYHMEHHDTAQHCRCQLYLRGDDSISYRHFPLEIHQPSKCITSRTNNQSISEPTKQTVSSQPTNLPSLISSTAYPLIISLWIAPVNPVSMLASFAIAA